MVKPNDYRVRDPTETDNREKIFHSYNYGSRNREKHRDLVSINFYVRIGSLRLLPEFVEI